MATTSRRPTRSRACDGTVQGETQVMDATARFSYHIETNREEITEDAQAIIVNLLREGILDSLIANHCPTSRRGGIRGNRDGSEPQVLSVFAKEVETTGLNGCPLLRDDSLSCLSYLSEVTVLYNSLSGEEQDNVSAEELAIQEDALSTIQKYMNSGLYTSQVNHELEGISSVFSDPLKVTGLSFLNLNGNPNGVNGVANENSVTSSLNQQDAKPFWILLGLVIGSLAMVLCGGLWRCYRSARRRKHRDWKGTSNDTNTFCATLNTGDESYVSAYLQDDRFHDEISLEQIQPATLQRAGSLTRDISEISQPKTSAQPATLQRARSLTRDISEISQPKTSAQPATLQRAGSLTRDVSEISQSKTSAENLESIISIIEDLDVEEDRLYNPKPGPEATCVNTRKCQSPFCQACRKASENDPNYLCPNYSTSEDVAMRSFLDDDGKKSTASFSIVPPSRVEKARGSNEAQNSDDLRLYASPARAQSRIVNIGRIPRTVEL